MNRPPPDWQPFARCRKCGHPACDHVEFRYWIRPYLLHLLPDRIARWLHPLRSH